jgi:UV excision repair protein RAD23
MNASQQQQQQQPPAQQQQTPAQQQPAQQPAISSPTDANAPLNLFAAAQQQAQQAQDQQQEGGGENMDFEALRGSSHFQQLRQLVQTNPALLQPLLQQIGANNPELLQHITQNPNAFFQALMEAGEDEEAAMPPSNMIQVTQEEKDAIDRLTALGFDRSMAAEAYFACDKNEELAANFLFEHGNEDYEE